MISLIFHLLSHPDIITIATNEIGFYPIFPNLAQTPISDTGLPMVSCSRDILLTDKATRSMAYQQPWAKWFSWPTRRPYKDYQNWFRTILRPWVEDNLLSQKSLERGYFNPEYIRNLCNPIWMGKTIRLN